MRREGSDIARHHDAARARSADDLALVVLLRFLRLYALHVTTIALFKRDRRANVLPSDVLPPGVRLQRRVRHRYVLSGDPVVHHLRRQLLHGGDFRRNHAASVRSVRAADDQIPADRSAQTQMQGRQHRRETCGSAPTPVKTHRDYRGFLQCDHFDTDFHQRDFDMHNR